jgi:hypothetical protein
MESIAHPLPMYVFFYPHPGLWLDGARPTSKGPNLGPLFNSCQPTICPASQVSLVLLSTTSSLPDFLCVFSSLTTKKRILRIFPVLHFVKVSTNEVLTSRHGSPSQPKELQLDSVQ